MKKEYLKRELGKQVVDEKNACGRERREKENTPFLQQPKISLFFFSYTHTHASSSPIPILGAFAYAVRPPLLVPIKAP